jgi:protein-tyrosine-phosphatase
MNTDTERLILFVCTGNTCRSPMAAAIFNNFRKESNWHALSGGLSALNGEKPSEKAVAALKTDFDLDISSYRSRSLTGEFLQKPELILTMTKIQKDMMRQQWPELQDRIMTIGEMADEPSVQVADPFGQSLVIYRAVAATLAGLIGKIIAKID